MVVRVGVGCFLFNSTGQFIVGIRKGSHGSGSIQLPGGHLEIGESFEQCAMREVEEETGIQLVAEENQIKFVTATNDVFSLEEDGGKHYVTIFVACRVRDDVEPKVLEPEKCESWTWMKWEELVKMVESQGEEREKLFLPLRNLIKQRPRIDPRDTLI
ncbi:hypothetical protein JCM5353_008842 [Sporobolomyces roseus]